MTLPRSTLRALRSIVARALGAQRSRVRVVDRVSVVRGDPLRELVVRVVATGREPVSDWWSAPHGLARRQTPRDALRYVARRAWARDMP